MFNKQCNLKMALSLRVCKADPENNTDDLNEFKKREIPTI